MEKKKREKWERERGKIRRPLLLSLSLTLVLSLSQTRDRLYFPSSAFRRGCVLIYFGNEGVTKRRTQGQGLPFYWNILQSHFAFFLLQSSTVPVIELCSFHVQNPSSCFPSYIISFFLFFSSSYSLFLSFFLLYVHFCSSAHRANFFLSSSSSSLLVARLLSFLFSTRSLVCLSLFQDILSMNIDRY